MKVVSALPKPVPPARGGPDAAPSRPFADFVAEPASRAAGFAELGMFGRNRAQAAAQPTVPSPAVGPVATAEPSPAARPAPRTVSVVDIGGSAPERPPLPSNQSAAPATFRISAVKETAVDPCNLAEEAPRDIEDRAHPGDDSRPARVRVRQDMRKPQPALAMHEADGVVTLAAGGTPIDPEARSQLRRLVAAILARSGLTLAQFHLNGTPVAPDHLGQGGGTHGPRTR